MKVLDSALAAAVVGVCVAVLAWAVDGDLVAWPVVAFLLMFIAAYMKPRPAAASGRRTTRRR